MRWVVSLIALMLVFPIAFALDISFVDNKPHYTDNSVGISFTTDASSQCSYSLFQQHSRPDFSCISSACYFSSCSYECTHTTQTLPLTKDVSLEFKNNSYIILLNDVQVGYYEIEVTCSDATETTSKKVSFTQSSSSPFVVDWSLLTRERFARNQESVFYAYMYGKTRIDSTSLVITYPDKTNKTYDLAGFNPGDGYLFSFPLDSIASAGKYLLTARFFYGDEVFELEKTFNIVPTTTFDISLTSPSNELFDIDFIDVITNITSFSQSNVSTTKISVPQTSMDVQIQTNNGHSFYFQNLQMDSYDLNAYYDASYSLVTEVVGENKPLTELDSFIFYTNNTPEYISKVSFDYSAFEVVNPSKLQIFKAPASSQTDVDITAGSFYRVGSAQNPLYIDEEKKEAYIFVNSFSLFSLVKEASIGSVINRNPIESRETFNLNNKTLEGIARDTWTFTFKEKDYSFLINAIDGAIVHFEFSPRGDIRSANVGSSFVQDLDNDQTDDIAFYVHAVTPSKIIFYVAMLPQPEEAESLDSIVGISRSGKGLYISSPLYLVYLGLALLVLFFAIVWFVAHGHKKPKTKLSKEEIEHLEESTQGKHPLVKSIKQLEAQGMSGKDIKNRLIVLGWPEDIVQKVLEQEQIAIQESTLTYEEQSVLDYVNKQIEKGATKELIKAKLLQVGWDEKLVEKVFMLVK